MLNDIFQSPIRNASFESGSTKIEAIKHENNYISTTLINNFVNSL